MSNILKDTTSLSTVPHKIMFHTENMTAPEGYRLAVIRFKLTKGQEAEGKKKLPARAVSVPVIKINVAPSSLNAAMQAAFEELQDSIIREHVEGLQDGSISPEATFITDDQISPEAVEAWFAKNAVSGKLSKETIGIWFDAELADKLGIALLAAKPELEKEPAKLEAAIKQHRQLICNLASPRANMPEQVAKQLKKAVALADDDKTTQSILRKLDVFLAPKEELTLLSL